MNDDGDEIRVTPPRIEALIVKNYRVLHDVKMDYMTPMTVLLGPNASGKSTVFDVLAFLSECFTDGLRRAWDKRGRFRELRSRGAEGPIVFEVHYREAPGNPKITYHLEVDEEERGPVVAREWMRWKRAQYGAPFYFLNYRMGSGEVISGDAPESKDERIPERLTGPEVLAVSTLGQLASNPRVQALREFIVGWYLSYLSASATRGLPDAGPQERLSQTGDNLPNVIQYLYEQHPEHLKRIFDTLQRRVPQLEQFEPKIMDDGRLLLLLKDAPFDQPIQSKFASDGTLKLLAYLTELYDPNPPGLIGIEEPENFLHPRLLGDLAEECNQASERTQLIVTTHSPFFINDLKPEQVRVLSRDDTGYTCIERAIDIKGVAEFMDEGGRLGDLWMEGRF